MQPRVRIIVGPNGIERVELWGVTAKDHEIADRLYFSLNDELRAMNERCKQVDLSAA